MRMEELKRGFWGYKKESVYRCITSMEEEFSARLMEKEAVISRLEEQYQERIQKLEAALNEAKREGETQKRDQAVISEALLSAQEYARQLREDSRQREEAVRKDFAAQAQRQQRELDAYQGDLKRLRETFRALLEEMDGRTEAVEGRLEVLRSAAPRVEEAPEEAGASEHQVI